MRPTTARHRLIVVALLATVASANAADSYPNELPGYEFQRTAKWGVLQPLLSTTAEVNALLGTATALAFDSGPGWKYTVYFWGEGGSCDRRPYPASLVGRVAHIELVPKSRVSFLNVQFPAVFRKSELHGSHDRVGSWDVYKDEDGLEYHVYGKPSDDGTIAAGDLRAIVYGPSRRRHAELTGCPGGWTE